MTATKVKERPILFMGAMVRAILDGRKTQTRRIIKPQPFKAGDEWSSKTVTQAWNSGFVDVPCPYGYDGSRLWVRETWQHEDGSCADPKCGQPTHIYYRATEVSPETMRWRPSIFMPRWASRITLQVECVRVERLKEISEADAEAEGFKDEALLADLRYRAGCDEFEGLRSAFVFAFRNRNGLSIEANPWLWVIEFKRAGQIGC